ncbi:MAG: enoyl-CoA hydratase/isomerase family protein [Casimicrobiaceae bacterium]
MSETCTLAVKNAVATVTLARPDVHNAFDETLIARLSAILAALDADPAVRAVILAGEGRSFCAGADLEWMRRMADFGDAENVDDARALAAMLHALYRLSKPTIARVHGAAFGGGVGLIAACDIAIGVETAQFALSEARLGLIPATIAPYVIEAIGARAARRYFVTAERFAAVDAVRIGLLHEAVAASCLDARIAEVVALVMVAGPAAQRESKKLIRDVAGRPIDAEVIATTACRIADVRASPEGREGVAAFLARRKPGWAGNPE